MKAAELKKVCEGRDHEVAAKALRLLADVLTLMSTAVKDPAIDDSQKRDFRAASKLVDQAAGIVDAWT